MAAFPIPHPTAAPRAFTQRGLLRRLAHTAQWSSASRLLELSPSQGSLELARELGCSVMAVDPDAAALEEHAQRFDAQHLGDRLNTHASGFTALGFPDASFDGVLVLGRLLLPLDEGVSGWRRLLAPRGRLVMTWPVRVGRAPNAEALAMWEARVGQPLKTPRDLLIAVERLGYEPETLETLGEAEVDAYYGALAATAAQDAGFASEVELHRAHGHRSGAVLAVLVARRKEPGERPPLSRDSG